MNFIIVEELRMKISAISRALNSANMRNHNANKQNIAKNNKNFSFKSIYIEDSNINLGLERESNIPPTFMLKDALMLDRIANEYPNQDCFIIGGENRNTLLEYREKPPKVQVFSYPKTDVFKMEIEHHNVKDYPFQPLLLKDAKYSKFIGLPTYKSVNPSLPFTIKAGFELQKKILEKKYKILDILGDNGDFDIGKESIESRSYADVTDMESSLLRFLIESAYENLQPKTVEENDYVHTREKDLEKLKQARKYDLTTSKSARPIEEIQEEYKDYEPIDICDIAEKYYPNIQDNAEQIEVLVNDMNKNNISLT